MEKLILKYKADERIKHGHPWIFSNEIQNHLNCESGSIVEVCSNSGISYGLAFYNPHSLVTARLLYANKFDFSTICERISKAYEYRKFIFPNENSFRLVFGESDLLPGLIVDKYSDYLAVQFLSAGMDAIKSTIVDALIKQIPNIKGIIEKDVTTHRRTEQLPEIETVLYGEIPEKIRFIENGINYDISIIEGQKTGYFLDQKLNRNFLQSISKDKIVLDCFCNQGGFALNAAKGGAKYVLGIDISQQAVESSQNNAKINNFDFVEFLKADVFEYLDKKSKNGQKWDIIVLDPPAFTKNRKTLPKAKAAYAKINRLALKMLNQNGFLVTSSCSHHLQEDMFYEILQRESRKLNLKLRLVFRGLQSPDHPILISMPETQYLKFFVFQVI
jgi:23S rRNA (cytosine1962-C5)-methyltransferase